jgi:hypothetical protein
MRHFVHWQVLLLLLQLLSLISADDILRWYREVSFSSAASYFAINGRGDTTMIGGNPTNEKVFVYNQNQQSHSVPRVTLRQTLNSPSSSTVDNFGRDLALEGDELTGNLLIIGGNGVGSTQQYNGAVYFFTGDNSQWSLQQILLVKAMMNEPDTYYGVALDLDPTTARRLTIGCSGCVSSSSYVKTGSIYLFDPVSSSSPRVTSWTEQQRLTTTTLYAIGTVDVEIFQDTLLGVGYLYAITVPLNPMRAIVFNRDPPSGRWSEVQILTPKSTTISDTDLYDDTMVLGSSDAAVWSTTSAGAVLVFSSSTSSRDLLTSDSGPHSSPLLHQLSPRPPSVQWSQQQVLTSPSAMLNGLYGATVKLSRDVMAVTEPGSHKVYVLERDIPSGMWSQQIAITAAASSTLTVEVKGSDVVVGDGTTASVYTNNMRLHCLFLSLEDQFGDGWGAAKLLIESPPGRGGGLGRMESLAPGCDRENPLGMRFCPVHRSDEGRYKLRVVDHEKAEFPWEIFWRVFDERSAIWYYGNWLTEFEVDWSERESGFLNLHVTRPLSSNTSCSLCPKRPTPRPSSLRRRLKGGTTTATPTYSPAPTLRISSAVNWRTLTLQDSANSPWHTSLHTGTSYYLSNSHGRHLLSVGTLCASSSLLAHGCWLDLPSGDYILRLGGALDPHKATHLWKYCSMTTALTPQTHLEFTITEDERCEVTSFYTRQGYCDHVANYDVILRVLLFYTLSDTATDTAAALPSLEPHPLSSHEIRSLQGILSTLLSPHSVTALEVAVASEAFITLDVSVHWDSDLFQSEEVYHEQVAALTSAIHSQLSASMSRMLVLVTSSAPQTSFLHHLSDLSLETVSYGGITGGSRERQQVVSIGDRQSHYGDDNELNEQSQGGPLPLWQGWSLLAWGGWISLLLAIVIVSVLVAGLWITRRRKWYSASLSPEVVSPISCVSEFEEPTYSPLASSSATAERLDKKTKQRAKSHQAKPPLRAPPRESFSESEFISAARPARPKSGASRDEKRRKLSKGAR